MFAHPMPKLRTFLALDSADKMASLEAIVLVLYAKALIASVPPRRWRSRFGAVARPGDGAGEGTGDLATIRRVRLALLRAINNLPGSDNCLPQALAGRWMLERRGIEASLFIGTKRDAAGAPRFHAWLKVGEEWVTGLCEEDSYALPPRRRQGGLKHPCQPPSPLPSADKVTKETTWPAKIRVSCRSIGRTRSTSKTS